MLFAQSKANGVESGNYLANCFFFYLVLLLASSSATGLHLFPHKNIVDRSQKSKKFSPKFRATLHHSNCFRADHLHH
uniref:Uncharacterized protein n=1 Tax=Anopheles darlingi TaxID=43151 RepID=A0A2M4D4S4_ANODA